MHRDYVSLAEVSRRWNIPLSWLYRRSGQNALPGQCRVGRYVRINLAKFEQAAREGALK
jgi:hypothetical protein